MYINTFKYTPKDVSCQLCTEYVKKLGCTALRCPWLAERIEAGVVGYREAVLETFPHERRLFQRLNLLIKHYPGSLWSNEQHERRMQYQCAVQGYRRRRDTNAYYAAMYLLTSNDDIYRRTANCFCKDGIEFGYYAFNTAYGMVSGAFLSLAGIALSAAQIRPILTMVQPFFDAVPEVSDGKQVIERLSGGIELNNVSFRYNENMPLILDDLSLKIRPGQYVAIVGRTGCGKSTLLRLLLGFEKPQKGAIYYDGKDLERIDLRSLRRRIGVVMQNGKLFQGDIYSNIVISAPWLSQQDAWEAAELTGIAEDIRRMPMGMNTVISEGSGGISGGQRQRLMIARAIAPKPKILMFDEATSALDNITQKKVSESLDRLKCTRIVIAHRLSTIRQCDRILVLDQGKIVEDGTYDELIAANGFFAELVARQRLDDVPDAAL